MTILGWLVAGAATVASVTTQRWMARELARVDEGQAIAAAFARATRDSILGVVAAMVLFFVLPHGPSSLLAVLGILIASAAVLFVRRRALCQGTLRRASAIAFAASSALYVGVALVLLA